MKIRPIKSDDIEIVKEIHSRCSDFPFPDLSDPLYVAKAIAEINGKIIALGLQRVTTEGILIMDLDQPRVTRMKAVGALLTTALQNGHYDEIHTFVTGEITWTYAELLKRKFGFEDVHGIPLVLRR